MSSASVARSERDSAWRAFAATLIMVAALIAGWLLVPKRYWFDQLGRPDLQQVVPAQFGDWVISNKTPAMMVSPELSETLRVVYSQTLSRVYVNRTSGREVMLSIAHGTDQSGKTQLHLPEGCYGTQGFVIDARQYERLDSPAGAIELTRFISHSSTRREPVTYWVRIGRNNIQGPLEKNLARLAMAAQGYIADGVLFRVSELSADPASSFRLQDQFMNDLVAAVSPAQRAFLIGSPSS